MPYHFEQHLIAEVIDGDEAHAAQDKLRKFYKKLERLSKKQEPIGRAQSDMDLSKVPQTAQSNICQEEIVTPNET